LTDVILPGINGKTLADDLIARRPNMKILFTSGYTENLIAQHGVLERGINFIGKPYSAYTLSRKIREIILKT
jgi:two-component system, cell cycle sensor histidine kinase and response regulator CckA